MPTTAVDDPIRADVERWLHAIVAATIVAPFDVAAALQRCAVRRANAVRARVLQPVEIIRSLFSLAARPAADAEVSMADPIVSDPSETAPATAPVDDADELPIDEYESLAASQVVARLTALNDEELDRVRRFEAAHRGRRTVLGKIDQLLCLLPEP